MVLILLLLLTFPVHGQEVKVIQSESVHEAYIPAPASILATECQSGAGGQIESGGFTVVNSQQFCDLLKLANVMREAAIANPEYAPLYMARYHEALTEANDLVTKTGWSATLGRVANQLLIPLALVAALVVVL